MFYSLLKCAVMHLLHRKGWVLRAFIIPLLLPSLVYFISHLLFCLLSFFYAFLLFFIFLPNIFCVYGFQ